MLASLSVTFEILIGKKLLKKNRKKTNASFITFFDIFELLLDTHAPLKKLLLRGKILLETMDYSWYSKIYES